MKAVINVCFGGFSLSEEAENALWLDATYGEVERTNPVLIQMVEEDAAKAAGPFAKLKVVDIPDNATDWMIQEYDGFESIIAVVDGKLWFNE